MSLVPRNAPCPCGSGRKYKHCCIAREIELRRRDEGFEELLALGAVMPRLRPRGDEFERWAADAATLEPSPALIREGVEHVAEEEGNRIVREYACEAPEAWTSFVADVGDEHEAATVLLVGGVGASLRELREPETVVLDLIEGDRELADDPIELLALTLGACDLWSLPEAVEADSELALISDVPDAEYSMLWAATLAGVARRLWSESHAERLAFLVRRLRRVLPLKTHPRASGALEGACDAFDEDPSVRDTLAAALLGESTGGLRMLRLAA